MSVRLSATTQASLNGCGGPWRDTSRRALNLMGDILSTYHDMVLKLITALAVAESLGRLDGPLIRAGFTVLGDLW
jgi:hypothetical protein